MSTQRRNSTISLAFRYELHTVKCAGKLRCLWKGTLFRTITAKPILQCKWTGRSLKMDYQPKTAGGSTAMATRNLPLPDYRQQRGEREQLKSPLPPPQSATSPPRFPWQHGDLKKEKKRKWPCRCNFWPREPCVLSAGGNLFWGEPRPHRSHRPPLPPLHTHPHWWESQTAWLWISPGLKSTTCPRSHWTTSPVWEGQVPPASASQWNPLFK